MSKETLRIIDVNRNRASEGLRFLEEIARFQLNDAALSEQLKTVRHDVVRANIAFNRELIDARNAAGDVGVDLQAAGDDKQRELQTSVVANARRVQESLRVLEELAKIPGLSHGLEPERYMHARFKLYTIEQQLLSRLNRFDKKKLISGRYVIIDTGLLKGRTHLEVAETALRDGARTIDLRDKMLSRQDLLPIARDLQGLCAAQDVLFIVSHYLDITLASNADGVRLGQDDLPVAEARRLLPLGKLIGAAVSTAEQARAAEEAGADYLFIEAGPVGEIKRAVSLPVVAVGGITEDNLAASKTDDADAVAEVA